MRGFPPALGRAEGPTVQKNSFLVVSFLFLVVRGQFLRFPRLRIDREMVGVGCDLRHGNVRPNLGLCPPFAAGASKIWGRESLAGNPWLQWLDQLTSFGEKQCRPPAWPCGGVRQLGVRGQAQGQPLQGTDGAEGT